MSRYFFIRTGKMAREQAARGLHDAIREMRREKAEAIEQRIATALQSEQNGQARRTKIIDRQKGVLAVLFGDIESIPVEIFARDRQEFEVVQRMATDLRELVIGACREAGFAPSIGMESPQISSAANLVAAGFGVAVVPASIRQIQVESVSYHGLRGNPLSTGIALIHRQREKSPTVLNFGRILRQQRTAARKGVRFNAGS